MLVVMRPKGEVDAQPDLQAQFRVPPVTLPPLAPPPREELGIISLTGQFVVRYGVYFMVDLVKRVVMMKHRQFDFLNKDSKFNFVNQLVESYVEVTRRPPKDLKKNSGRECHCDPS